MSELRSDANGTGTEFQIVGVHRASGKAVVLVIRALSAANAKVKAELRDVAVTSVEHLPDANASKFRVAIFRLFNCIHRFWNNMTGIGKLIVVGVTMFVVGALLVAGVNTYEQKKPKKKIQFSPRSDDRRTERPSRSRFSEDRR